MESDRASIAAYLKIIGRGAQGARALNAEQARELMGLVLDHRVTDLEIGAFAVAMRVKGETLDELRGFLAAAQERCRAIQADRPVVLLPSYNGARKLPNLTPLLALRLAREGTAVLVHGTPVDASRVTTAQLFLAMGLSVVKDADEVPQAWARQEPAYLPIDALSPPLARLLAVRNTIGIRNSGHTVAKMLLPVRGARALRVVNHTHPEFGTLMAEFARHEHADMLLLRGTEGEPVADPRRTPKLEVVLGGEPQPALSQPLQDGTLTELPPLPASREIEPTVTYTRAALAGEAPMPAPIERQVQAILQALARIA